jgi:hypothetical protein
MDRRFIGADEHTPAAEVTQILDGRFRFFRQTL